MSLVLELHEAVSHLPKATAAGLDGSKRGTLNTPVMYCLLVIFLPILAIPAFILLGKSDFFLHHGASAWVQANDAIFDIKNRSCDVLVYGDSTAMTGIDPEIVDRETGFKTCNIAVTNAVLAVTGNLTLDRYLQQNGRPKVLVVQLSPDDFQARNRQWKETIYAEGLLELLRHGSTAESGRVLINHPREAVSFAGYAAGFTAYYAIKEVLYRTTHVRTDEDQIHVRNGFFTPPAPARTYCDTSAKQVDGQATFSRALADDYRQRYAGLSSVVLVDVAPIPSCDSNLADYAQELSGVTSNSLQSLPIGLFNDGRHYTAFGSRVVSTLIAQQVNEIALTNPAIDDRVLMPAHTPILRTVAFQR